MKFTLANVRKSLLDASKDLDPDFFADERISSLKAINAHTKRNVVLYHQHGSIDDDDVDGFISACSELTGKSLDLIIHGPGGFPGPTESIVNYLRETFSSLRIIVPRDAMSAATLLACSGDEILMASHSCLGPTDPQRKALFKYGKTQLSTQIMYERMRWYLDEANDKEKLEFIDSHGDEYIDVEDGIQLSKLLVSEWLNRYMLKDEKNSEEKSVEIAEWLSEQDIHKFHGRPLHRSKLRERGLKITDLEQDAKLYGLVMKAHYIAFLEAEKVGLATIICSQEGGQYIQSIEEALEKEPDDSVAE